MNKFMQAVRQRADAGYCVGIFPEAHIWPYCNFIRPYKSTSFRYPAMWGKPVVSVCVTYQKNKGLLKWVKHPRRTIYVSEPFYADASMSVKEAQKYLHEKAYAFMCETSSAARIMRISNIFKGRGRKKKQTNKTDQKADVTEKELTAGL